MDYTLVTAIYTCNQDIKLLLENLYNQKIPVCICIDTTQSFPFPPHPSHIRYIDYPRAQWKVFQIHPKIYQGSEEECYKYEIKYFLEKAIQENPYHTQQFTWATPQFLLHNRPIQILQEIPLLFFSKNKVINEYFDTLQIVLSKDVFVSLDVIVCKRGAWEWFIKEYNMIVYQYVFNNGYDIIEESFYSSLLYLFPRDIQNIILYD